MAEVFKLGDGEWLTSQGGLVCTSKKTRDGSIEGVVMEGERSSPKYTQGKDGNLYESVVDEPAISYANSAKGALLLEPASSNECPISFEMENWVSGAGSVSVDVLDETYKGLHNIRRFNFTGDSQSRYVFYDSSTYPVGTVMSFQALIRGTAGETIRFGIRNGEAIHTFTGGWDLATQKGVTSVTNTSIQFNTYGSPTARVFDVAYVQVEPGDSQTSYIPTYGSAVSRAADTGFSTIDISKYINSSEGVFEFKCLANLYTQATRRIGLFSSDGLSYVLLNFNENDTDGVSYGIKDSGTNIVSTSTSSGVNHFEYHTFKIKWGGQGSGLKVDGVEIQSQNSTSASIQNLTELRLYQGNFFAFRGEIEYIKIYDSVDDY